MKRIWKIAAIAIMVTTVPISSAHADYWDAGYEYIDIPCGFGWSQSNNSYQIGNGPWLEYIVETTLTGIPCQVGVFAEAHVLGVGGSASRADGIITATASMQVPVPDYGRYRTHGKHSRATIFGEIHLGDSSSQADVIKPTEEPEPEPEPCNMDWAQTAPGTGNPLNPNAVVIWALAGAVMLALALRTRRPAFGMAVAVLLLAASLPVTTNAQHSGPCEWTPLLIDTKGNGFHMTNAGKGVMFDIDADGTLEQIGWTRADSDDAWLAMDRNGNGTIDNGSELFGNYTPVYPDSPDVTSSNGFEALKFTEGFAYGPSYPDSVIDARDAVFGRLLLWYDLNHNGISEPDELTRVAESHLQSIKTDYRPADRLRQENVIRLVSNVMWADGTRGRIVDVWLDSLGSRGQRSPTARFDGRSRRDTD